MLRWVIRAAAANRYKNKVISESNRASTKSKDAVRSCLLYTSDAADE